MKYKPYTDADIQCITENMHLPDRQIAEILGRTQNGVAQKRFHIGLEKVKGYTTGDLRFIKANIDLTDSELAEELGRSRAGIEYIRNQNNIMKRNKRTTCKTTC